MTNPDLPLQTYYKSPLGLVRIEADDIGVTGIYFTDEKSEGAKSDSLILQNCIEQLEAYFSGGRTEFTVPLHPLGSDFQLEVWNELLKIPFGRTSSYMEVSKKLGDPKKIRAVGNANGKNKISIVIPCHRVIGSDGSLVGYAGGLEKKKWLLDFEAPTRQTELFGKIKN